MDEQLRFSQGSRPSIGGRVGALCVLLLLVILGFALSRTFDGPEEVDVPLAEEIVDVRGDVPEPGFYALQPPLRVHTALRAAGLEDLEGIPDAGLEPGTRVVLDGRAYLLESMDRPLVIGLPVDINRASQGTLESIPGIGPSLAEAIVQERESGGAFQSVQDLERVKGIGPATVDEIRSFLTVGSD